MSESEKSETPDGIDVLLLEKRLEGLRDTQESVQGLSLWCQANKKFSTNIIDTWLRILRKSPVEKRLTMFYLANDVVQHAKRKGDMVVVNQWAFAVQKATPHVRTPSSVSSAIARIFKIWEERSVYSKDAVADLLALLNNVSSKEKQEKKKPETYTASADKVSAFQPSDLIQKFKLAYRLKSHLGVTFRSKQFVNMDMEQLKLSIKDRNHGSEVIHEIAQLLDQCRTSESKLQNEVDERRKIVETAEIAIVFYENVRGEAKIVNSAYKNFTNRVFKTKEKVDEKIQAFDEMEKDISPLPSPPAAAPSPENFPDVQPSLISPVIKNQWPAAMTELFQTYASGGQYSFDNFQPPQQPVHDVGSIPLPPPLPADNNPFQQPPLPPLFENSANFDNGPPGLFDNMNNAPGLFDNRNTTGTFDNLNNSSGMFDNVNSNTSIFENINNSGGRAFDNLNNNPGGRPFDNVNNSSTGRSFDNVSNNPGGRSFENSSNNTVVRSFESVNNNSAVRSFENNSNNSGIRSFENTNNNSGHRPFENTNNNSGARPFENSNPPGLFDTPNNASFDNGNNMSSTPLSFENSNPGGSFDNQPGLFENNPSTIFDNHPQPVNNTPTQQSHEQNPSVFLPQSQMPFELHQQNQQPFDLLQNSSFDRPQQNNQSQPNANYDPNHPHMDHRVSPRFNYHPYNNSPRGHSPRNPRGGIRGKFQGRPGSRMDGPRQPFPGKFNSGRDGMNGQKDSVKDYNQFNYNSPRGGPRGRFPNSDSSRGFTRRGDRF